jgi:hypothetical protein
MNYAGVPHKVMRTIMSLHVENLIFRHAKRQKTFTVPSEHAVASIVSVGSQARH